MIARYVPLAVALAALPAALSAEPWDKVDELPGGIAIELDLDSAFEALDGAATVQRGVFRRENGGWTMETDVAIDCESELVKIRGMRLRDGAEVLTDRVDLQAEFMPINAGSSEAIYYKALCGRPASVEEALPEATEEDEGIDLPPGLEPEPEVTDGDLPPGEETVTEDTELALPPVDEAPAEDSAAEPPAEEVKPDFGELFGEFSDAPAGGDAPE